MLRKCARGPEEIVQEPPIFMRDRLHLVQDDDRVNYVVKLPERAVLVRKE